MFVTKVSNEKNTSEAHLLVLAACKWLKPDAKHMSYMYSLLLNLRTTCGMSILMTLLVHSLPRQPSWDISHTAKPGHDASHAYGRYK